jgi:hypothetical protein
MVAVFGGIWLSSGLASAQTIELSLSLMTPPKHLRNINVIEPWIKMVDERTQGKVKIKPFFSSTLAQPQESFDAAASGVCDIAESYTFGNPGRFALSETLMLPEMGFPTGLSCGRALWHLYKTFPEVQAEYKGVKMLWLHSTRRQAEHKKKPSRPGRSEGNENRRLRCHHGEGGKGLRLSPVTMSTGDL